MRAILVAGAAGLLAVAAQAQEIEPRAYSNAPVGVNFVLAGYAYSSGGVAVDPVVPLENADIRAETTGVGFVRTLDLWGLSGKVDASASYGWISGSADYAGEPVERDVSGWTDPRFRVSVNLFGAPALGPAEFARYRQDVIVGASLQVTAPWGQYDSSKIVNNGTNRWTFKPELGVSKAIGRWTLELAGAVKVFGDNDDFFGGQAYEQDPIWSLQGHVIYGFPSGIWVATDATWYRGGRTYVNDVRGNDLQKNTRAGITVALPVNRQNSVKIYGSSGVSTRTGADYDQVGVAWQYRWGAGF